MSREFNFCGIFVAPFFIRLVLAVVLYTPVHWLGDRLQIQRWVWNRPVVEAAVFIIILGIVVLSL